MTASRARCRRRRRPRAPRRGAQDGRGPRRARPGGTARSRPRRRRRQGRRPAPGHPHPSGLVLTSGQALHSAQRARVRLAPSGLVPGPAGRYGSRPQPRTAADRRRPALRSMAVGNSRYLDRGATVTAVGSSGLARSVTLTSATSRAARASWRSAANVNCVLIVPANPLTAQGLATPYQLIFGQVSRHPAGGCLDDRPGRPGQPGGPGQAQARPEPGPYVTETLQASGQPAGGPATIARHAEAGRPLAGPPRLGGPGLPVAGSGPAAWSRRPWARRRGTPGAWGTGGPGHPVAWARPGPIRRAGKRQGTRVSGTTPACRDPSRRGRR